MKYLSTLFILLGIIACNPSTKKTDAALRPILSGYREAPLGWVYLRAYADSSFKFILTGLRDRHVYSGTYQINADTIYFKYADSVPKLNSFKAIITHNSIVYVDGSYPEILNVTKNELSMGLKENSSADRISKNTTQSLGERYHDLFARAENIDDMHKLDSIILENDEFLDEMTDGGGELIGYFLGQKLVKIISKIGFSYGIETSEYYFESSDLFFVRETLEVFQFDDSLGVLNYEETEVNYVGEYIFNNERLIDLETLGHYLFEDDEIDIEKAIISMVSKYRLLIQNKEEQ